MYAIMIFSVLPTIWVIIKDDSSQKALRTSVDQLSTKLDPFIDVARSNYPDLSEHDALEELRLQLYHPRDRLRDLIDRIIKEGGMSDGDAVKLVSLTKQLIEHEKQNLLFPVVLFYCDWVLSPGMTKSSSTYLMLSQITDVFLSDNGLTKVDVPLNVSKLISIQKFRGQLLGLYSSHKISTILFTNYENWKALMNLLLKEIVGKTIEFPPDVENSEDSAGVVYREMKKRAAHHEMLMARKLWLSDNVEGNRKGDVYWFVETKPRVMICGRLFMVEEEKDFISKQ